MHRSGLGLVFLALLVLPAENLVAVGGRRVLGLGGGDGGWQLDICRNPRERGHAAEN